jgi:hypothetical protein
MEEVIGSIPIRSTNNPFIDIFADTYEARPSPEGAEGC